MGNVRSLDSKMDELATLVKTQREFRECCVMCFTETWLHSCIPDSNGQYGWTEMWRRAEKKKGGGGCAVCQ